MSKYAIYNGHAYGVEEKAPLDAPKDLCADLPQPTQGVTHDHR